MIGERDGWKFPLGAVPPHIAQLKDFRNFLALTFHEHGLGKPTLRQYEVAHFLQHGDGTPTGDFKVMVQGYRGMGKSTITGCFIPWLLFWWPQKEAILLSAAETKAKENCQFMRELFATISVLRPLEPRPGQRDSALAFNINGKLPTLDPSVHAIGIMGQITGFHADVLICDDIEVENNSETPAAREKLDARSRGIGGMAKPHALRVFLGTPQTEDTIYLKIPQRGYIVRKWPSEYPTKERRAGMGALLAPSISSEVEADEGLVGTPTDGERYSTAVLQDRRIEYGAAGYALQFILDTTLSDAERFPLRLSDLIVMDVSPEVAPEHVVWASGTEQIRGDIPCLGRDGDRFHQPMRLVGEWLPYTGSVMAVDPSGRGKDEMAWCVVKVLNGQLFVVDFGAELDGFEGLPRLAQAAVRYKPNVVRTEDYGGGSYTKLLGDALREAGHPCQIEEVTQTRRKEKRIIETLEPIIARHRLVVDAGALRRDYETARARGGETWVYYALAHQLTRIADVPDCLVHDDRVDALAMAVDAFASQVELSPTRYVEARAEEERARRFRERQARLEKLDPKTLEPNALRSHNRGLGILRGRGMRR